MSDEIKPDNVAIALFSEVLASEQLMRARLSKALPKGMELSHFVVLNYLNWQAKERTPVELARSFNLTKGAMTNTIGKLERLGYIHVRPDWDDARRKLISISDAGTKARNAAILAVSPIFEDVMAEIDSEDVKVGLKFLRQLRTALD